MVEHLGKLTGKKTKRFMGLECRLITNPEMNVLYPKFIHGYLLMGHMRQVRNDKEVIEPNSTTTKFRVVHILRIIRYTDSGVFLSGTVMVGPVFQDVLLINTDSILPPEVRYGR